MEADREILLTAYQEVCRSYERIDDFRAKLLGLLPAISGAGVFLLLSNEGAKAGKCASAEVLGAAGAFGAIVTLGLLCYEERGIDRCVRLASVGSRFEQQLGVSGRFIEWPHSVGRIVNEPFASGLIYSAVFSAWLYVALMCISLDAAIASAASTFVTAFFPHELSIGGSRGAK